MSGPPAAPFGAAKFAASVGPAPARPSRTRFVTPCMTTSAASRTATRLNVPVSAGVMRGATRRMRATPASASNAQAAECTSCGLGVVPGRFRAALLEGVSQLAKPPRVHGPVEIEKEHDPGGGEAGGRPVADEEPQQQHERERRRDTRNDDGHDIHRRDLARVRHRDVQERVRCEHRHVPRPPCSQVLHSGLPEGTVREEM